MAKADVVAPSPRSPRGAKPVTRAFFAALESIPEATRAAVAKAAQTMIRDELKLRRDKLKAAAAKEKARKPVIAKPAAKAKAKTEQPAAAPAKRRTRKPAYVPAAA